MNLYKYLSGTGETDRAFSERSGIGLHSVRKYKSGERIPRPEHMAKIKKATKGKVSEADCYQAAADFKKQKGLS